MGITTPDSSFPEPGYSRPTLSAIGAGRSSDVSQPLMPSRIRQLLLRHKVIEKRTWDIALWLRDRGKYLVSKTPHPLSNFAQFRAKLLTQGQ
jgi:hypothetical protein